MSEIKIVNFANLEKIAKFMNDSAYRDLLETGASWNTKTNIERKTRRNWFDPQTGVAQNNCQLFMSARQRMPGLKDGQIYTYPSARWRKSRRQYLKTQPFPSRPFGTCIREPDYEELGIDQTSMGASGDGADSKDSYRGDDMPKEWFYDEYDHDMEAFDEHDQDNSDNDYEVSSHYRRERRKRGSARHSRGSSRGGIPGEHSPSRRGRGGSNRGRGRGKSGLDMPGGGNDKYNMDKHRGRSSMGGSPSPYPMPPQIQPPTMTTLNPSYPPSYPPHSSVSGFGSSPMMIPPNHPMDEQHKMQMMAHHQQHPHQSHPQQQPLPPTQQQQPHSQQQQPPSEQKLTDDIEDCIIPAVPTRHGVKGKHPPNPYCDFCLGDARENKKTGTSEDLVSCSDCGRSGHPSCLQFTANMIISVKKYRWQCIECKYCSICGTSDNDDQLLFCDDCDRGYHMYCLAPPLINPPEGSWSCNLCYEEFHSKKQQSLN